jgi:dienelactone hydrolase
MAHPGFPSVSLGAIPVATPGPVTRDALARCLGEPGDGPEAPSVETLDQGVRADLRIHHLRWPAPFGPPTVGWLLTPARGDGPWPGVILLHDHGGWRWHGKEKLSDGLDGPDPLLLGADGPRAGYAGRAWADDLAREGFCVLVHDAFTWGSRRIAPADLAAAEGAWIPGPLPGDGTPDDDALRAYHAAANQREHTIAKQCALAGRSFPGLLLAEDRLAVAVLRGRPECAPGPVGVAGHSGGGARAAYLAALEPAVGAAAVLNMMTTFAGLAGHRPWLHSWQLIPPGWPALGDWPDIPAAAGVPLLTMSGARDGGFHPDSLDQAHRRLSTHYAPCPERLHAAIHPDGHVCTPALQAATAAWMGRWLAGPAA